jgi:uncharacterized protein (TIGR03437 family)
LSKRPQESFGFIQALLTALLFLMAGSQRLPAQSTTSTWCDTSAFDDWDDYYDPFHEHDEVRIASFTVTRLTHTNLKGKVITDLDAQRYTFQYDFGGPVPTYSLDGGPPRVVPGGDVVSFVENICAGGAAPQSTARRAYSRKAAAAGTSRYSGQYAATVAMADFNGDGNPDSAVLQGNGININLYDANSNLISSRLVPLANANVSILTADFNGDGKFDLAVITNPPTGPGNVTVLLGNGDGTFGPPSAFPAGAFPFFMALSDFNNDGKPDLAVSTYPISASASPSATGTVAVLLGDGHGGFAAPVMYPVGKGPVTLVADDFTGDGIPDIVVLDQGLNANAVWTLPGKGDGTFMAAISTPTPASSGYISYADFDHDGNFDLLIADVFSSTMVLMLGKGDGTFKAAQRFTSSAQGLSLGLRPLQDGNTAIMVPDNIGNEMMIYFSDSSGVFHAPAVQTFGKAPVAIAAGDIDGDGKPDLVIADSGGSLYTEISRGAAGFTAPQSIPLSVTPAAVALSDLNHDGYADAIVASSGGLAVLKGSASGALSTPQMFGSGQNFVSVVVADFNGDGEPDAAAASSSGALQIFVGNGDATFRSAKQIALPSGMVPRTIVSADVNKDGKADLIVALGSADFVSPASIAVALGNGDGTFQTPSVLTLPSPIFGGFAVGDLNNDGVPDLVISLNGGGANAIAVLLGKGDGTFGSPILTPTTTMAPQLSVADMNGDGKPDVIAADCCGLSEASFLGGNGDGTFQAEIQFPSGPNPLAIAIADFDGDKKLDIAIAGQMQLPIASLNSGALTVIYNAFGGAAAGAPLTATVVSSADPHQTVLAPASLATAYGSDLATGTPGATSLPLPPSFGGTFVSITDSSGATAQAPLLYVSPGQVNFEVPQGVASGAAQVTVTSADGARSIATVQIAPVAPAVFELNSAGLAAADVLLVSGGSQTYENVYTVSAGQIVAQPVSIGSASDQAYLLLYGTGLRAAGTSGVSVKINGTSAPVQYAGPQGSFAGLDQMNVLLPPTLAGAGAVTVQLQANGITANAVTITVK